MTWSRGGFRVGFAALENAVVVVVVGTQVGIGRLNLHLVVAGEDVGETGVGARGAVGQKPLQAPPADRLVAKLLWAPLQSKWCLPLFMKCMPASEVDFLPPMTSAGRESVTKLFVCSKS